MRTNCPSALLALLLALPAPVKAQVATHVRGAGGPMRPGRMLTLPFDTLGAHFLEDENTVAHVYWNGSALVDTKNNAWGTTGSPPMVAANALPTLTAAGGVTLDGNNNLVTLGTGNDVLDFSGDWWACFAFVPTAASSLRMLANNGG